MTRRLRRGVATALALLLGTAAAADPAAEPEIFGLQPRRTSETVAIEVPGRQPATATLVNLNPRAGGWYVLFVDAGSGESTRAYHLENPRPGAQALRLDAAGLRIFDGEAERVCPLWPGGSPAPLEQARRSGLPYAPLCEGRLYLRNPVAGRYTLLERTTEYLRDYVWGGERIVQFVRNEFYRDAFIEHATPGAAPAPAQPNTADLPQPARLAADGTPAIEPGDTGIDLGPEVRSLGQGQWYPVRDAPGIYLSAVQPQAVDPPVEPRLRSRVDNLDSVEAAALDYLVAFDLDRFDLGFMLGTDHPRLGWSERTLDSMLDPALAGPDGIDDAAPLVRSGMVSPALAPMVAATFTGGFKREHGAFHYGDLAYRNHGSHYGFIEQGTVFSTLQPGLATVYVLDDGSVGLKTWSRDDDALLPYIRHARQNGVALIDDDPASHTPQPGPLVTQWGPGNWSGSKDEKLRTLRAGLCLSRTTAHSFLVYGYFSTATPRAMARVFQAYGCSYAMHLDMNALEHTYLAVYTHRDGALLVQHLIQGMAVLDRKGGAQATPRFLGFPDDRDFFYLVRRGKPS